jgi:hypothetical protein
LLLNPESPGAPNTVTELFVPEEDAASAEPPPVNVTVVDAVALPDLPPTPAPPVKACEFEAEQFASPDA